MKALNTDISNYYEAKGLIKMLREVRSGALAHKRDNLIQVLSMQVRNYDRDGFFKRVDALERVISKSKDLMRDFYKSAA